VEKDRSKLEIKDIASVEIINETESPADTDFDVAKEKISDLKKDAAETAEGLASINSTIKEFLARMEKLKKLEL
jgi:hypothetical protein